LVCNNYRLKRPPTPILWHAYSKGRLLERVAGTNSLRVALLDTAVQSTRYDEPFLLSSIPLAGTPRLRPGSPTHGTAMMQHILQNSGSNSSAVQILPIDIYGPNTFTTSFEVVEGIRLAAEKGCKIIYLGCSGAKDCPLIRQAIHQISKGGVLLVMGQDNDQSHSPHPVFDEDIISSDVCCEDPIVFNNCAFNLKGTSNFAPALAGALAFYMVSNHASAQEAKQFMKDKWTKVTYAEPGPDEPK
jgi:hypothetical protein